MNKWSPKSKRRRVRNRTRQSKIITVKSRMTAGTSPKTFKFANFQKIVEFCRTLCLCQRKRKKGRVRKQSSSVVIASHVCGKF